MTAHIAVCPGMPTLGRQVRRGSGQSETPYQSTGLARSGPDSVQATARTAGAQPVARFGDLERRA
jgi:hypothetical protein